MDNDKIVDIPKLPPCQFDEQITYREKKLLNLVFGSPTCIGPNSPNRKNRIIYYFFLIIFFILLLVLNFTFINTLSNPPYWIVEYGDIFLIYLGLFCLLIGIFLFLLFSLPICRY